MERIFLEHYKGWRIYRGSFAYEGDRFLRGKLLKLTKSSSPFFDSVQDIKNFINNPKRK